MMAVALPTMAALPQYGEPSLIGLPEGSHHPALSPDGTKLLFSTVDHTGLKSLDFVTGKVTEIDQSAAAGFQPVFSVDGSKVYYRTATMVNGLLNRDVRSYDMTSGKVKQLRKPDRSEHALKAIDHATYVKSDFDHIDVTINGVTNEVRPIADGYTYQWASLSPDGTKLLFTEPFKGVFVSDLDGGNPHKVLAKGDYPCWISDTAVACVVSHDDGYLVLDSAVVIADINSGEKFNATGSDILVDELTASPLTGRIIYSTADGKVFNINPLNADK